MLVWSMLVSLCLVVSVTIIQETKGSYGVNKLVTTLKPIQIQSSLKANNIWEKLRDDSDMMSTECFEDLMFLFDNHTSYSPVLHWQQQMLDSNGNLSAGFIEGNKLWMGDFTQCTMVEVWKNTNVSQTTTKPPDFRGQHCFASFNPYFPILQKPNTPVIIGFAFCVPSTCNVDDLEVIAKNYNPSPVKAKIESEWCKTNEPKPIDWIATMCITPIAILVMCVCIGTIYDFKISSKATKNYDSQSYLLAFSARTNTKQMLDTSTNVREITCLSGLRVLSQMMIVVHHVMSFFIVTNSSQNRHEYWHLTKTLHGQIALMSTMGVNTFFCITGFLLAKEAKRFNMKYFLLNRIWRLTPMLMTVVAFVTGPFIYLSNGPLNSSDQFDYSRNYCIKNWWKQLLFIDSYYVENKCAPHTWYLQADMFCFVLAPLILYPSSKKHFSGALVWIFFLVSSLSLKGLQFYLHEVNNILSSNNVNHNNLEYYVSYVHTLPFYRMHVVMIGMFYGYLYYYRRYRLKFTKFQVTSAWVVAALLPLGIFFIIHASTNKDVPQPIYVLYGTFSDAAFTVSMGWVILACSLGYGGFMNSILSWKFFLPLSKLSFGIYLIHYYVIVHFQATRKMAVYVDFHLILQGIIAVFTISLFFAWILYILVDAPFVKVKQLFLKKKTDSASATLQQDTSKMTSQTAFQQI